MRVRNYETQDLAHCVAHLDLLELKFVGFLYTWMSPDVCSKLDRVLVNQAWAYSNYNAASEFITPGCISDHSLSIVSLLDNRVKKDRPFKFFNMWAISDEYNVLIESYWRFMWYGTTQYRLKKLLNDLKNH